MRVDQGNPPKETVAKKMVIGYTTTIKFNVSGNFMRIYTALKY